MTPSRSRLNVVAIACVLICAIVHAALAGEPGTAFTYQGRLRSGGNDVNGLVNFQFKLFNASSGGGQVGPTVTLNSVAVDDGLFTVSVDFGAAAFDGGARWLEVVANGVTLSPRQRINPTPYALQTRGLFVDSSQFVGINTTSPQSRLDVAGDVRAGKYNTGAGHLIGSNQSQLIPNWTPDLGILGGLFLEAQSFSGTPGGIYISENVAAIWNDGPDMLRLYKSGQLPGGSPRFAVNGNGWVGVGHGSPVWPVHVIAPQAVARLETTSSQNGSVLELRSNIIGTPTNLGAINFVNSLGSTPGQIAYTGDNQMTFRAAGVERMRIDDLGTVAIGGTSPFPASLYVTVDLAGMPAVSIDRNGDGGLVYFYRNLTSVGSIMVIGSTVSYNAFTGSHYAWLRDYETVEAFSLMRLTGENRRVGDDPNGEVVYGVEPTARANDPACLGAYLGHTPTQHDSSFGSIHLVMAVGNGEMRVVDAGGGDIEPGDLLISSDVGGCAMKDDPSRFSTGHIVARAAQRVRWADVPAGSNGVRSTTISVLFEHFTRQRPTEDLAREVEDLKRQVKALLERDARMREADAE